MSDAHRIAKKLDKFKTWLSGAGAEVLKPTNEWELVRFKSGGATSIIYKNKSGRVAFTGEAETAWRSFESGASWRGGKATERKSKRPPEVATLLERDGPLCFFCQSPMGDDMTVEHLVACTHGGPNHISNKFLAHRDCNARAGHLSAPEKVRIHATAFTASAPKENQS